ncbi:MAG: hypothetical protein H0X33_08340 [Taibaiella sp.]|nr:hypothetical protein [Taibaiella sp.]
MTEAETLFHKIAADIPDAKEGKMFGALCIKAPNGKAGVMFWKEYIVIKLGGEEQEKALQLKNAKMFDPMGNGRAMNGWVQLGYEHKSKWETLSHTAMESVKKLK